MTQLLQRTPEFNKKETPEGWQLSCRTCLKVLETGIRHERDIPWKITNHIDHECQAIK